MTETVVGIVERKTDGKGAAIFVNSERYGSYMGKGIENVNQGDNVEFQWDYSKDGKYKNIKGNARVVGGTAAPTPATTTASSAPSRPSNGGGGWKSDKADAFPLAITDREVSIVKRHAISTAVELMKLVFDATGAQGNVLSALTTRDALEEAIELARKIEDYTAGFEITAGIEKKTGSKKLTLPMGGDNSSGTPF